MRTLLYIIAGLLGLIWGLIYFGGNASGTIHLVLTLALVLAAGTYFFYNSQKRKIW